MALFPYYEQGNLRNNLVDNVANPQNVNCRGPNSVGAQKVKILICPAESACPNGGVGQDGTLLFRPDQLRRMLRHVGRRRPPAPRASRTACST